MGTYWAPLDSTCCRQCCPVSPGHRTDRHHPAAEAQGPQSTGFISHAPGSKLRGSGGWSHEGCSQLGSWQVGRLPAVRRCRPDSRTAPSAAGLSALYRGTGPHDRGGSESHGSNSRKSQVGSFHNLGAITWAHLMPHFFSEDVRLEVLCDTIWRSYLSHYDGAIHSSGSVSGKECCKCRLYPSLCSAGFVGTSQCIQKNLSYF